MFRQKSYLLISFPETVHYRRKKLLAERGIEPRDLSTTAELRMMLAYQRLMSELRNQEIFFNFIIRKLT